MGFLIHWFRSSMAQNLGLEFNFHFHKKSIRAGSRNVTRINLWRHFFVDKTSWGLLEIFHGSYFLTHFLFYSILFSLFGVSTWVSLSLKSAPKRRNHHTNHKKQSKELLDKGILMFELVIIIHYSVFTFNFHQQVPQDLFFISISMHFSICFTAFNVFNTVGTYKNPFGLSCLLQTQEATVEIVGGKGMLIICSKMLCSHKITFHLFLFLDRKFSHLLHIPEEYRP